MKKLFLLLLLIPYLVLSQNKVFDFNEFDKFSEEYVNNDEPGIIYNIYSDTKNINWSKAFGINDVKTKDSLNKFGQFRIASVTKTFVAASVLRLWEEKKILLDESISKYISNEHQNILIEGGYNPEIITVRHLLNHSSGMYDHTNHPNFFKKIFDNPDHKWTRTEQIKSCIEWGNPVGSVGNQFKYSDTGYVILGGIIENITKSSLDNAIKKLLRLKQLNINDTWFEDERDDRRIHQYFRNGKDAYGIDPSIDYFGGGGLISTAEDLSRFFYLLFNNKVFNKESTLQEMLKKYKYKSKASMDYSLGIWEIELSGLKFYTHSGFWGTQVVYSPKHDISFSVNYSKGWSGSRNAPLIHKIFDFIENKTKP